MQSGDMPSMEELMSNPSLRNLYVLIHVERSIHVLIFFQCQSVWSRPLRVRGYKECFLSDYLHTSV